MQAGRFCLNSWKLQQIACQNCSPRQRGEGLLRDARSATIDRARERRASRLSREATQGDSRLDQLRICPRVWWKVRLSLLLAYLASCGWNAMHSLMCFKLSNLMSIFIGSLCLLTPLWRHCLVALGLGTVRRSPTIEGGSFGTEGWSASQKPLVLSTWGPQDSFCSGEFTDDW